MIDFLFWAGGIIAGGVFGLIGWAFRMIWHKFEKQTEKHDQLETRFDAHRLFAAETFATKNEVETGFNRIIAKLDKIDEKLDRKVDKQ